MSSGEEQPPPAFAELEELETLPLELEEEIPEEEMVAPESVGQVTVGNRACLGTNAYIDVYIEIQPAVTSYVYLAVGFFSSSGAGLGSTGLLGPYRPTSASQRYIGRRITVRLTRRCASIQGFGSIGSSGTLYRSPRVPFACGPVG